MKISKDTLSVPEFLSVSGIDEKTFCTLVHRGLLKIAYSPEGSAVVDVSNFSLEAVARADACVSDKNGSEHQRLIEERIASRLLLVLDEIIEEALELADAWHFQQCDKP